MGNRLQNGLRQKKYHKRKKVKNGDFIIRDNYCVRNHNLYST